MDPVHSIPAIVVFALAALTSFALVSKFGDPSVGGRYASVDGLRGYLAIAVFLHHSCIWYFYLQTGRWETPPSALYTHFGQSAVALFFMITGFLFVSKLLDGRSGGVNWGRLYVSRIFRLIPMYFFIMSLFFVIIFILSEGKMNVSTLQLLTGMMKWLGFTIWGSPVLNEIDRTGIIIAGVTWSLPYEWLFYFMLPFLALILGLKVPIVCLMLSVAYLALTVNHLDIHCLSFMGGIAAAFLSKMTLIRRFAMTKMSSGVGVLLLITTVCAFPDGYGVGPFLLLSVFFIQIASGNDLFGLLACSTSRMLGEISYSIYLIHGIFLFCTFTFILGISRPFELSAMKYWAIMISLVPVLITVCFVTFKLIEQPAMGKTSAFSKWLEEQIYDRFRAKMQR